MHPVLYQACTRLKYQIPLLLASALWFGWVLWRTAAADVEGLDRSTYIALLGAMASVVALFCSVSLSWVLFISQQNRTERIATYDLLKAKLSQVRVWMLDQPASEDRELCLSVIYELDKHEMSDLPQTDRGDEYRAYVTACDEALDGDDKARRRFYQISVTDFAYIESLLNRIAMISIRQIITKIFIDTLAKGFGLVGVAVLILAAAAAAYDGAAKKVFLLLASLVAVASVQLFLEFFVDLNRIYNEELDFIEAEDEA